MPFLAPGLFIPHRFAAALRDLKIWVMNVISIESADTLPIIYERGLFGIYHDWCESFSTYPRSYDLLHADHLFSKLKTRCVETLISFISHFPTKYLVRLIKTFVKQVQFSCRSGRG